MTKKTYHFGDENGVDKYGKRLEDYPLGQEPEVQKALALARVKDAQSKHNIVTSAKTKEAPEKPAEKTPKTVTKTELSVRDMQAQKNEKGGK